MLYIVIGFLWLSICLYLLFGGADFGAGIVELLTFNKRDKIEVRQIMDSTMGPVWEANHMWLIIFIVIMFVGFPQMYSLMSTYNHIPLILMLLGVIARGTSYTFRHYDVINDNWEKLYSKIFIYASFLTPLFLGIVAGSAVSGSINTHPHNFLEGYVYSWLTPFNISVGIFTSACCAYLAAIYAIKDVANQSATQIVLIRKAKQMMLFVILSAILVFGVGMYSHLPIIDWIYKSPIGTISVFLSVLCMCLVYFSLVKNKFNFIRFLAASQIGLFLVAGTEGHFPYLIYLKDGSSMSLLKDHGADTTINCLAWALLIGSCLILPFLIYLIIAFSRKKKAATH